jgi:hypothetical protein
MKKIIFTSLIVLLILPILVLADPIITNSTSVNFMTLTQSSINISINNIDTDNITSLNISFPDSIHNYNAVANLCDILNGDLCGNDAGGTIWYNSSDLGWYSDTGLILPGNTNNFWFEIIPFQVGEYNLSITTSNSTGSVNSNFTIYVYPYTIQGDSQPVVSNGGNGGGSGACIKDTMLCSDGTYVERNYSNSCIFNKCPVINSKNNTQALNPNLIYLIIGGIVLFIIFNKK